MRMEMSCAFVVLYVRHGGHGISLTEGEAEDSVLGEVYCGREDTAQAKRFSMMRSVT